MPADPNKSKVLARLKAAYAYKPEDVDRLTDLLYQRRLVAWRSALIEKAGEYGYVGRVYNPGKRDRAELRRQSRQEAEQIARTWQKDIERQLTRLYQQNPRGNRYFYIKHMEQWAERRDVWKARQIANNVEQTTRRYAFDRFLKENGLANTMYVFVGPPPVCDDCARLFGLGPVRKRVKDQYPTPRHPNCRHEWIEVPAVGQRLPAIPWVGRRAPHRAA